MLSNYAFGNPARSCLGCRSRFVAFPSSFNGLMQTLGGTEKCVIIADIIWHCFWLCVFLKDMVKQTKAKTFQAYLDSCHRRYSCVHCRAHLANHDDLISKVRVPLCDSCGTFTARFVNWDAVCIKDSRVCLCSVISRQSGTCLPVQFCVSIASGEKKSHRDWITLRWKK